MAEAVHKARGSVIMLSPLAVLHVTTWRGVLVHLVIAPFAVLALVFLSRTQSLTMGLWIGIAAALTVAGSAVLLLYSASRACHRSEELDDLLFQSRKMAAVGEMSAGIAHEINTPLNIISQELEWLQHLLQAPEYAGVATNNDFSDSLQQIGKQVRRCSEITHGMLHFARAMHTVQQSTDVSRLMDDMVGWVEREGKDAGITFVRHYEKDLPEVMTDAPMLRHVVLNLLNNAVQALEMQGKGGVISASTHRDDSSQVILRVEDNGPGIHEDHLASIFNPFFTTKPPGKGTGLGLAISLAIVSRLGGSISVKSEPGHGACFDVRLPLRHTPPERQRPGAATAAKGRRGNGDETPHTGRG